MATTTRLRPEHDTMPTAPTQALVEPAAYSPDRCAEAYDVGRTLIYQEIASGRLRARKLGRRTIITRADADAWIKSLPLVRR
jgi:excisionase family DNA binding protein